MQLITTTELRTRSKELVSVLLSGRSVDLVHRSKIIAELRPKKQKIKLFNAKRIERIIEKLNFEPLTDKEIEKRYRQHLMKKYGNGLS